MARVSNQHRLERKNVENLSTRPPLATMSAASELWQTLMNLESTWPSAQFSVLMSRIEYYRMIKEMLIVVPIYDQDAMNLLKTRVNEKLVELYTSLLGPEFKKALEKTTS